MNTSDAKQSPENKPLGELDSLLALAPHVLEAEITDAGELARCMLPGRGEISATADAGVVRYAPTTPHETYLWYVLERWCADNRGKALPPWLLNGFYATKRVIPRSLQLSARRRLMRWQGLPTFPSWPLDTSVSVLLRFYAYTLLRSRSLTEAPFGWFWPDAASAALVLSHDVESESGLRRMAELADLEEECGFRSAFNLGAWVRPDPGLLADLTARGFEIGVHGLSHDRSLFASRAAFESQLPALRELRDELGAHGFRSPAIHRVVEWMGELPFDYDGTFPNSDPWEAQPGGCCSVWPFFIGGLVELPYTLPQDHTLFTLLGHRSPELWLETAERAEEEHGLIQFISHPDEGYLGDSDKRAYYREFLQAMTERDRIWRALPLEVASWWRSRATSPARYDGSISIGRGPDEVLFDPPPVPAPSMEGAL